MKKHLFHLLAVPIIGIALALFLIPTASLAATAAGTKISNTASVTWSGAAAAVVSDPVVVTVNLLPSAPTVAYDSTNPAGAAVSGTGTGAASPVIVTYTVTSTANGGDDYTLDLSSVQSANLGAPTLPAGGTIAALGASMALNDVADSNTVVIPGLAADHGLAELETVIIGGTPYTINSVSDNGTDTTLTLSGSVTMTAGSPIYERRTLNYNITTGTFTNTGITEETHTLTLTATSVTAPAEVGTIEAPVIYVARASLMSITKSAAPTSGQPGDIITYTIIVTNGGTSSAANVTVTDAPPAFTSYVAGSTELNATPVADVAGNTPLAAAAGYNIGSLAGGASATITFQVKID